MYIQHSSGSAGVYINYGNTTIGDSFGGGFGTKLQVQDTNKIISSFYQTIELGLKLDFVNDIYYLGSTGTSGVTSVIVNNASQRVQIGANFGGNSSIFGIDDNHQTLFVSSNLLIGTSGSSSGLHLKINVDGNDYVIELKNP